MFLYKMSTTFQRVSAEQQMLSVPYKLVSLLFQSGSCLPAAVNAQQLWCQSLKPEFSLCFFKKLQTPTVQTQSLKSCQDLVLFRIRNTEPQKTVKSNRG